MKWYVKAVIQKIVSGLPCSAAINRWMQNLNGNESLDQRRCARKWTQVEKMLRLLQEEGIDPTGSRVLEIGAGRHMVGAFALRSAGVREVISYDLEFLSSYGRCRDVIRTLIQLSDKNRITISPEILAIMVNENSKPEAVSNDRADTVALLRKFGIEYRIGRVESAPETQFDLFFSISTLEHIPVKTLGALFRFYFERSTPGACMAHAIDMKDHFSQDDRNITKYNFLKFSDRTWRLVNSSLNFQNRLRASDYRAIAAEAGWVFVGAEERRKDAETLVQVKLAPRFRSGYTVEDLEVNAINAVWRR